MTKSRFLYFSMVILVASMLMSSPISGSAEFPYNYSTGDIIQYEVASLKNGTSSDWLWVWGINLTAGDSFGLEIFDHPAEPTSPYGFDIDIRFVKGDQKGNVLSGNSLIFTSNKTYWSDWLLTNSTFDVGGTIYDYTIEGETGHWSWTTDADNLVEITFDLNDGSLLTYERKTTNFGLYNYTHFKFVKGSGSIFSDIPGFELPILLFSISTVVIITKLYKK